MKTTAELRVRLKVTDLVTQTAWMTLTEKLGFAGTLRGMVHYWFWRMEAEGAGRKEVINEIDRVIRLDGAFTNQNKHLYLLNAGKESRRGDLDVDKDYPIMDAGAVLRGGKGLVASDCLVRERRPDREIGFAERLNARLKGVAVSNMVYGELWRLIVRAPSSEAALAEVEKMLVSRSRREGLLLNPHYQQYEIIGTTELAGRVSAAPGRAKE